ncbi:para-aminobenzoate synthase [Athelia psychrophila]|uniref:aminodeoxychorismate synthase n=1 Tax=Athelia psychrophila TaxID=1759441 RepID=A0A166NRX6_9AGAM|nr:para-aminobenzoate synthase [Fibularhizoctonia sp. CBS 109695]
MTILANTLTIGQEPTKACRSKPGLAQEPLAHPTSFNVPEEKTRVLLIDSYDSFTYNLASLCRQSIPNSRIHIIKNDQFLFQDLLPLLAYFDAVIVGPGPGSPEDEKSVGVIKGLWKIADANLLPIFGVCLGLQSLGIEFGATLKRLSVVKHGQISRIHHVGTGLFKGVGDVDAVRYHSLHVEFAPGGDLEQLGWSDDSEENGLVVMALKHKSKPFWAVQYHPESVCTEGGGSEVIVNFWRLAKNWARIKERSTRPWDTAVSEVIGSYWPKLATPGPGLSPPKVLPIMRQVTTTVVDIPDVSTETICEHLGVKTESAPFVLLDSAAHPGRFTIIGALTPSSPRINYRTREPEVTLVEGAASARIPLGSNDIWSWLSSYMRQRKAEGGNPDIPFWGGLVGYLSYELGLPSLSVPPGPKGSRGESHPDVNLVFVERSIVRDSVTGKTYLQTILPNDDAWLAATAKQLQNLPASQSDEEPILKKVRHDQKPTVAFPDKASYISRIKRAKEHLFAGNSYEICVTAPTRITRPKSSSTNSSSWELYQILRRRNPAPHSGYLRLSPSTLVASSPERFISYTRGPHTLCQLRPIKGTLRKGPGIVRATAEEKLAGNKKEVAENLMIVDLIRHDLHGVLGADVQVKKFCGVEENETVWSLVSVIEGRLPPSASEEHREVGWEVLSQSLPPGSMTGAPKKRSVEILQTLEDCPREIYSGVFGYWCVGGSGDWSVVIRSCFKYDDDKLKSEGKGTEEWTIGAGGAITALSDPEAEWDEMVVKLQSALRAFGVIDTPSI